MFNVKTLIKKAKKEQKTIVFPEASFSERTQKAVEYLLKKKIAKVILLGDPETFKSFPCNLHGATVINPKSSDLRQEFVAKLYELRQHKGMTMEVAEKLIDDNMYFATMLVYFGYADGYVAGAESPTDSVLRPALQIIKTREGISTASSCFMMVGTGKLHFGENNVLFTADCALNVSPNAQQLCDIALSTAETARSLTGIEPRIAMLSYSSFGSAKDDETILKSREAISLVKAQNPSIKIDGEMQLDCAIIKEVAKVKAGKSDVAGKANILIYPDLNSGNIGYKSIQRFGSLRAVGVIMQGLNKPVNDLSRGCDVMDIVLMGAITAIQSCI